jgi:hypothetical protein
MDNLSYHGSMTFKDIIDKWPSIQELAAEVGVSKEAVRKWRERKKIPPLHWFVIEQAAMRRGLTGITAAAMASIKRRR